MSVNGKRTGIEEADILALATFANMRERRARAVLDEVRGAVRDWPHFASEAGVRGELAETIARWLEA